MLFMGHDGKRSGCDDGCYNGAKLEATDFQWDPCSQDQGKSMDVTFEATVSGGQPRQTGKSSVRTVPKEAQATGDSSS